MNIEVWKKIEFSKRHYVSNLGRIKSKWSHKEDFILKQTNSRSHGRPQVNIYGETYLVQNLVCEAFHGKRPEKLVCSHIDGNIFNNSSSNLTWETQKDNQNRRVYHGTDVRGDKNGNSKLSENVVKSIRDEYSPRVITKQYLSNKYNVSESTISDILRFRTWKHI